MCILAIIDLEPQRPWKRCQALSIEVNNTATSIVGGASTINVERCVDRKRGLFG